jgi:hypothetical protein
MIGVLSELSLLIHQTIQMTIVSFYQYYVGHYPVCEVYLIYKTFGEMYLLHLPLIFVILTD